MRVLPQNAAGALQRADLSASEPTEAMSTTNAARNEADGSGDDQDLFTPVEAIQTVDEETLDRMQSPEVSVEDGEAVFAVASRVGVMRTPDNSREFEVTAVLYLTQDGRQAVERFFSRGLSRAPRACVMPAEKLHQAVSDGSPHSMAALLSTHPEVSA